MKHQPSKENQGTDQSCACHRSEARYAAIVRLIENADDRDFMLDLYDEYEELRESLTGHVCA